MKQKRISALLLTVFCAGFLQAYAQGRPPLRLKREKVYAVKPFKDITIMAYIDVSGMNEEGVKKIYGQLNAARVNQYINAVFFLAGNDRKVLKAEKYGPAQTLKYSGKNTFASFIVWARHRFAAKKYAVFMLKPAAPCMPDEKAAAQISKSLSQITKADIFVSDHCYLMTPDNADILRNKADYFIAPAAQATAELFNFSGFIESLKVNEKQGSAYVAEKIVKNFGKTTAFNAITALSLRPAHGFYGDVKELFSKTEINSLKNAVLNASWLPNPEYSNLCALALELQNDKSGTEKQAAQITKKIKSLIVAASSEKACLSVKAGNYGLN